MRILFNSVNVGLLIAVTTISAVSAFNFQSGNGGAIQYALGCDFYGNDIGQIPGPGEQCGGNCLSNSQCTHFTWYNNVCYIKRFTNSPIATSLNGRPILFNFIGLLVVDLLLTFYFKGGVCGWAVRSISGGAVQLSVKNNCGFTTWLATAPNTNIAPLGGTVQLNSGQSYTYNIPSGGWAGRFWPKTGKIF